MDKSISEILKEVNARRKVTERAASLKLYDSEVLRGVLFVAFTPQVQFALPEGAPPFKPSEFEDKKAFFTEWRNLGMFLKNGPPMSQLKREVEFQRMLEKLTAEDARLMLSIKDHKFPYPRINPEIVNLAFPGLLANG